MAVKVRKNGEWIDIAKDAKPSVTQDIIDEATKAVVNKLYPVGSVYISINSTDPSTLFSGTTWAKVSDGYFMRASSSGGLTQSAQSLPSHSHSLGNNGIAQIGISYNTSWGNFICYNLSSQYATTQWYMTGNSYHPGETSVQMPPLGGRTETTIDNISGTLKPASVDVVMWYRTA